MFKARATTIAVLLLATAAPVFGQENAERKLSVESSTITAHDTLTVSRRLVPHGMVWRQTLADEIFVVADVVLAFETTNEKRASARIEKKQIKLSDAAGNEYPMVGNLHRFGNFTSSTSTVYLYASAKFPARRRVAPVFIVPKTAKKLALQMGPVRTDIDVPALSPEPQPDEAIKFEVIDARFQDEPFELKTRVHSSPEMPYRIEPAFGRWLRVAVRVSMPKSPRPGLKTASVYTQDMALLCKGMVLGAVASEKNGKYYPPISGSTLASAGSEPAEAVFFVPVPEDAREFELLYLHRNVARGKVEGGRPVKMPAVVAPSMPAKIPELPAEKVLPPQTRLEVKVVDTHVQDEINAYPRVHVARGIRHLVREPGIKYVWFETAMVMHWGKDEVRRLEVKKEEFQLRDDAGKAYPAIGDMEGGGDGELRANSWSKSRPSGWERKPMEVRRLAPLFAVPAGMKKATLKIGEFAQEVTLPPVKPAIQPSDTAAFRITGVEIVEPAPFETRLGGKTYRAAGVPTAGRWLKVSFEAEGLRPTSLGFDYYSYSTHEFGLWYDGVHRIAVAQSFGKRSTVVATTTMPIKGASKHRPGGGSYYFIVPEDAKGDIVLTYQLSPVAKGKIGGP